MGECWEKRDLDAFSAIALGSQPKTEAQRLPAPRREVKNFHIAIKLKIRAKYSPAIRLLSTYKTIVKIDPGW